ncbi:TFIIH basal transcription factor complex, subunit SSL1 [Neoconidiobolus thromboides FSU 785]|nr:TFIIH basal transcription factor complex, subunit SSL1 [Neoconidiobolus thromboides FSU 785]
MSSTQKSKTTVEKIIVDDVDDEDKEKGSKGFSWEETFKRSWEEVQEDEKGSLQNLIQNLAIQLKKRRQKRDTAIVQRGIIRHMILIVDLSLAMNDKDLRPSRLLLTLAFLESFITEYFDQNPISQLGIIVTRNGLAEKISELSGNPMEHIKAIKMKSNHETGGEPSLQNSLELAKSSLIHIPSHASREVLSVFGSLTSCDPGNIFTTIKEMKQLNIRCSTIGLSAQVAVFQKLANETMGTYNVVFNENHFKDILFDMTPPPIVAMENKSETSLILMGFPERIKESDISLCCCHNEIKASGFRCPQCQAKVCEIPTECNVCGLTLISSPHLARSYHHLFPIDNFIELKEEEFKQSNCSGCFKRFEKKINEKEKENNNNTNNIKLSKLNNEHYQCPKCQFEFCIDCDIFIHDNLHNCPGCSMV